MKLEIIAITFVVAIFATMTSAQHQPGLLDVVAPAEYTVHQPESFLTPSEGVVRNKRQFGYGGYGGGFRGGYGGGYGGRGGYGGGYGGGRGFGGGGYGGYGGGGFGGGYGR